MKPIFLSFTAFGPYLQKTEVDFASLNRAALFLICGPTGGGKTSILDAMCFALYCRATGGKRDFRSMRCAGADMETPTSVEFQFALGNRDYRFFRSLYSHINRRTKQPESREIHECHVRDRNGEWQLLESGAEANVRRRAEALLHLTCEQFSQVIVLPQGDFLKLLRASSKEKGDMLKTLFAAEIWQKITDNAALRLKTLDTQSKEFYARRSSLLEQAACETTQALEDTIQTAQETLSAYKKQRAQLAEETAQATALLEQAATFARLLAAGREAAAAQEAAAQQAMLAEKTFHALKNAKNDAAALRTRANLAGKEAATLQQQTDMLLKAENSQRLSAEKQKQAKTIELALEKAAVQAAQLEKRMQQGRDFVAESEKSTEDLSRLLTAQAAMDAALATWQELTLLLQKREALRGQEADLNQAAAQQKLLCTDLDRQLDAQNQIRQENAAFSLAQDLRENEPCPVCGAVHHPAPAFGGTKAMDNAKYKKLQETAQAAARTLQTHLLAREAALKELAALDTQIVRQEERCKTLSPLAQPDLQKAAEAGRIQLEKTRQSAGKLQRAREKVEQLAKERDALLQARAAQREQVASLQAEAETLRKAAEEARAALPGMQLTDIQARQTLLLQEEQHLNKEAQALADQYEQAMAAESRAKAALAAAQAEREKAQGALAGHKTRWSEADQPDIPALQEKQQALQRAHLDSSTLLGSAQSRLAALTATLEAVTKLDADLLEIQGSYETAARLSHSLKGDNAYKMPILQYVLGMMLEEILASSNQFFGTLSRGRYALRLITQQKTGNALRGLDLEVLDGYSMMPRSIETLSGGEQFLASLSLAFGLSDVVQNYSGAVRLDALFIDEGFGTLDGETLDVAMKALNTLHEGGRTVGIISHVAELKTRISSRVEIHRDSAGHASLKIIADN